MLPFTQVPARTPPVLPHTHCPPLPHRDAAAPGSKGLLQPLVRRWQAGGCSSAVFALPAVSAVISYKWDTWARRFLMYELAAYCAWLAAFTSFSLMLQVGAAASGELQLTNGLPALPVCSPPALPVCSPPQGAKQAALMHRCHALCSCAADLAGPELCADKVSQLACRQLLWPLAPLSTSPHALPPPAHVHRTRTQA
jgi:hypothetical protein